MVSCGHEKTYEDDVIDVSRFRELVELPAIKWGQGVLPVGS